jgi:hypothetical protein
MCGYQPAQRPHVCWAATDYTSTSGQCAQEVRSFPFLGRQLVRTTGLSISRKDALGS